MARLLDKVLGHKKIIQNLSESKKNNKWPSTFLFVGPEGIGKKSLALAFVQTLLCENDPLACGECGPCLRVEKKSSEGLLIIEPEKNNIKLEKAKEVLDFLSLRTLTQSRAIIIDGAEYLNPQASNSLLKILEEPPENTYFFLMAPSSRHVIATIRSRAQIVHCSPLSENELASKVRAPEWALKASLGRFSRLNLLLDSDELEVRNNAIDFLSKWMSEPQYFLKQEWKNWIHDKTSASSLANHLVLFFRDAQFYQLGSKISQLLNPDQVELIKSIAQMSPENLNNVARDSIELENSIKAQRDLQLVFEEFWIRNPYVTL